ncbi:MAG: site-2 protease family protein [Planctomycetes bacterium]|nr:site-2 protease family protein [Planctomycetota bacterium]
MRDLYPGVDLATPGEYLSLGLLAALAFFGCILLHELGHAIVGQSLGIPIRGITLFIFGGVAEMGDEPASAGKEFWMAIAGPLVSLFLVIVFTFLAVVGFYGGWAPAAVVILAYLAWVNALVLAFNLIPAFPLDGGRVLRSILWAITENLRRATQWAAGFGRAFSWLLIAWGVIRFIQYDWLGGIWVGLVGLFLGNAARSSLIQVLIRQALKGEPVRRFMNPEPIVVPPTLDLKQWVDEFVYRHHRKAFPVVSQDHHLEGVITTQVLGQIPRAEWELHNVGEVMRHDLEALTIAPEADALDALQKMQRTGISRLMVTDGDRLVGIIGLKDLLRFLNLKIELEGVNATGPG